MGDEQDRGRATDQGDGALWSWSRAPTKDKQSVVIDGPEKIRVSTRVDKDGPLLRWLYDDVKTLYEGFRRGVRASGEQPCIGKRSGPNNEFVWLTYNEVIERATNFGSGILGEAIGVEEKGRIGIFACNCPEWTIVDQACSTYSLVTVPLYETLGLDALSYIIKHAQLSVVVCDASKITTLFNQIKKEPFIQVIIKIGEVDDEEAKQAGEIGVKIFSMEAVECEGQKAAVADRPPTGADLYTVCFTSGTTGNPKGVMITHENMVSIVTSLVLTLREMTTFDQSMRYLSYLPLAHIFERNGHALVFMHGGRIGFYRGDIRLLSEDLKTLKPTLLATVPRLLNRIYDRLMAEVRQKPWVMRKIFNMALEKKKKALRHGKIQRNTIWDKLVFHKVQEGFGGCVQFAMTGAAPISDEVLTFIRCAMGCHVFQGYGQTESCGGTTMTIPFDGSPGHVGPPVPSLTIKLVSVPELNYVTENNEGEVCMKGSNVFTGYLNDEDKTKEALDEDGWLHSGDIGRWNPDGTLSIIDRKKQIFKLAQGEYIAPERVEVVYEKAPLAAQVFVHGDSLQSCCVAVVVPDEDQLRRWAEERNISGDFRELCENAEVQHAILQQMTKLGKESDLKSFEQAKALHLHAELFSTENNLLTPTFKLKRPQLKAAFADQIAAMYEKLLAEAKQ